MVSIQNELRTSTEIQLKNNFSCDTRWKRSMAAYPLSTTEIWMKRAVRWVAEKRFGNEVYF
ncbi:hypothetical protein PAXRUDRAFT_504379 [Paxillus rubicundulus Ve08.2h10]|uniref:Uncharacterized protein n=1 Tax=Paxillus rubicundulus Ve08.2h10 TaxID=930991 RepID=A0A0D0E9K7_9AGAM|nr:hypothetical protein PAXRUDRAFT_504379 [Paxillus rubicundulus Ve08.2h10]